MLVDGRWDANWQPVQGVDAKGGFVRKDSTFRNWVTPDGRPGPTGEGGFPAAAGRYHLYVALVCPWASRTLAARALKRLEGAVSVSAVEPSLTEQGWRFGRFPGAAATSLDGDTFLHQVYTRADPHISGRATVPVLWDRQRCTIVNNESADILRMLTTGFGDLADSTYDLYPAHLAAEIDALGDDIYPTLNNGVYRAGFATTQAAYEEAFAQVFDALDRLERRLKSSGPFLFGDRVTESDLRVFVTTVRFDAAYHGLFKLNRRRLADYPRLSAHLEAMLALPGVAGTVDIGHIKAGYYSVRAVNPTGIVPVGPDLPWMHRLEARTPAGHPVPLA